MEKSTKVKSPIINSPYEEPHFHWHIPEHEEAEKVAGRRLPLYRYTRPGQDEKKHGYTLELKIVSRIRREMKEWLPLARQGEGGVSAITAELINYWRREGREHPLFFAQVEAAETIIFLTEARADFLQGLNIPLDEPENKTADFNPFRRLCCKMATGAGKTTVMGMLAAWSILNKMHHRNDRRFADAVLVVCPNITIRNRLAELDTRRYESSIYRTRDLVPPRWAPTLAQGRVLVVNWHLFEPHIAAPARVQKNGVRKTVREIVHIGSKTQTARGKRYMTLDDLWQKADLNLLKIITDLEDGKPPKKVEIESEKYIESDAAIVRRVLQRDFGGKRNILVFNDEAHHAYRLRGKSDRDILGDAEATRYYEKEATVWVEGLDRVQKERGINVCVDFSATPYYLTAAGENANRVFPWVVSDFGMDDAIEAGLVKIPQFAFRDVSGTAIPGYFNIWEWILSQVTDFERGGRKGRINPITILKYAHTPLALLGGEWQKTFAEWAKYEDDPRPPVFIIVCRDTELAKLIYQWLAEDNPPEGIAPANMPLLCNAEGRQNTIRVDVKMAEEIDSGAAKSDETKWMRYVLDTIGKTAWPTDGQSRPIFPEGFVALANKMKRGIAHPPGRDVRCIVSVSMLTEGWDCSTVTHIAGLRPFMSQLLCEQVVGRGLRRASYSIDPQSGMMSEEIAKVFGVPLQNTPLRASGDGQRGEKRDSYPIYAMPERVQYQICFPRVCGYRQEVRQRITLSPDAAPTKISGNLTPTTVDMAAGWYSYSRPTLGGPGDFASVTLEEFRRQVRLQQLMFYLATHIAEQYVNQSPSISMQSLFPQVLKIVSAYFDSKVEVSDSYSKKVDGFLAFYYDDIMRRIVDAIRPDGKAKEEAELPCYESLRPPGGTHEVSFQTVRPPYPVIKSHVNAVVADTEKMEQSAAFRLDHNEHVFAFAKNEGMGFAIPYTSGGKLRDYMPDFIIRLATHDERYLILETKGYDKVKGEKEAAVRRWVQAVNAEGSFGFWHYRMIDSSEKTDAAIAECLQEKS